jgi:hypothetical protein
MILYGVVTVVLVDIYTTLQSYSQILVFPKCPAALRYANNLNT